MPILRDQAEFIAMPDDSIFLPATLSGAEIANLPSSQVTKLGCFYLAAGLQALAGEGEGKGISRRFAQQLEKLLNVAALKQYKLPDSYLKSYDRPQILQGFARDIKKKVKRIINDRSVSTEEVAFLKFAVLFMENPTKKANYLDRAKKHAMKVSAAYYRNFLKVSDVIAEGTSSNKGNVIALQDELAEIVAQITGKKVNRHNLTVDTKLIQEMRISTASKQKVELAKRYKEIRRHISVAIDMAMASYLANENGIVPVHQLYQHMVKLGFLIHKVPPVTKKIPLKVGLYGGKLKYYTEDGRPLDQAIPSIARDIKFPSTYNPETGVGTYLTYTSDVAYGITRVFTETHTRTRATNSSEATVKINSKINSIVARWKKDLTSDKPLVMMGATAAVMIYLTAMRVGARQTTAASSTGVPTYGAISLRPRHITLRQGSILIKYKGKSSGKSGVEQKHIIRVSNGDPLTKRLYNNLKKLMAGKKGEQLVFSVPKKLKPNSRKKKKDIVLNYGRFRQYLEATGYPGGIHKIRRVRGTNLMIELMNKHNWKPSKRADGNVVREQKEAEQFAIEKILIPIANLLGHKSGTGADLWRTTAKSYIEPEPLIKWFSKHNLRTPKWLPAKASKE